jgi:hypothetical protein
VTEVIARLRAQGGAPPPEEPAPDPVEPAPTIHVTGQVLDYWTNLPIARANLQLGELGSGSDDSGRYVLEGAFPPGDGIISVFANRPGYWVTNTVVPLSADPITHDVYAASVADVQRQLTNLGLIQQQNANNVVIVDLVDAMGDPVEKVPISDLNLVVPRGAPDGYGPVFFGPDGDVRSQADLLVSQAFDGRARAAFFNVGHGTRFVQAYTQQGGSILQGITSLEVTPTVTIGRLVLQTT